MECIYWVEVMKYIYGVELVWSKVEQCNAEEFLKFFYNVIPSSEVFLHHTAWCSASWYHAVEFRVMEIVE